MLNNPKQYSSESNEISDYQPVLVDDPDDLDPRTKSIGFEDKPSKCSIFFRNTIATIGYIVLAFNVVYLSCLIALLHQGLFDYVRESLSGHTTQPTHPKYADNCDFTWNNLISRVDIWMSIHFVTYCFFAFAVRNRLFLWINSLIWEIIEYIYFGVAAFNMTPLSECWFDSVIFDVLIANALGIECGLFILKYVIRIYPLYNQWCVPLRLICQRCNCGLKWFIIIFNMLFLLSLIQLFAFAFCVYTLWIDATGYVSVARFWLLMLGSIGVFYQCYQWMYEEVWYCGKECINKLYWILVIWSIIILESVLTVRHYLK